MILFYILILIPIITSESVRNDVPSYRSTVMEGDKPILRMPMESAYDSGYESDVEDMEPEVIHVTDRGEMIQDVSLLIRWLIDNFGYDVLHQIRRNKGELDAEDEQLEERLAKDVEADEIAENTLIAATSEAAEEVAENMDVGDQIGALKTAAAAAWQAADKVIEVAAEGLLEEEEDTEPVDMDEHIVELREMKHKPRKEIPKRIARMLPDKEKVKKHSKKKNKLRERKKSSKDESKSVDPNWMTDLKEFMKDLIARFGQKDLDKYTKPVITSVEKKHNVLITDIDVDQYAPPSKTLRYNPKTED